MKKKLLYLKENSVEKTLLYCQNEVKLLLKNTSVPKRKRVWRRLLYINENLLKSYKKPLFKITTICSKAKCFFVQSTKICSKANLGAFKKLCFWKKKTLNFELQKKKPSVPKRKRLKHTSVPKGEYKNT